MCDSVFVLFYFRLSLTYVKCQHLFNLFPFSLRIQWNEGGNREETVDITTYLRLYLQTYFETKRDEKRVLRKNKMVKKVISTDIFT